MISEEEGKRVNECMRTQLWSRTDWDAHTWCAELIRNRVSRNRFRLDGLARACGPPRYYVGKLIILSIMPDLCLGRALRVRWRARPKSYSLAPNSLGIIDSFSFFMPVPPITLMLSKSTRFHGELITNFRPNPFVFAFAIELLVVSFICNLL